MIRYSLLALAVTFLSVYAFRDWYRSLCGLIVMMAFVERDDMPRQIFGITGINSWNLLMAFILLAWFLNSRREQLRWDLPKKINFLLLAYFAVVTIGFIRMSGNMGSVVEFYASTRRDIPTYSELFFDDFLNNVKYVIPGLLLFHGCNSKSRLHWGIVACLLPTLLLGLQIIQWMPLEDLSNGEALSDRAKRVLDREIGYHRVDLAALMASGSWAFFISRILAPNKIWFWISIGIGILLILSLALTGGRAGYVSWLTVALILSALKWKRLLLFIPILVTAIVLIVPAARERMLQGFDEQQDFTSGETTDLTIVTSDRTLLWPTVIRKIGEAPLVGYGRKGYFTSGASLEIRDELGRKGWGMPHPHNAYLEFLIDNGLIGAVPVFLFFFIVVKKSAALLRDTRMIEFTAIGGISMAFVAAQLVASIGSQSFYPRAGVVLMWCVIGLMFRASIVAEKMTSSQFRNSGPNRAVSTT